MPTRGVFALIMNGEAKTVLISERADGKGWELPGGGVKPGENDHDALKREVLEEIGLEVDVIEQIGPPHVFKDDTAVAYACKIVGGVLGPSKEMARHAWCTKDEAHAGRVSVAAGADKGTTLEIVFLGPRDRLGRMRRMLWDGFSIMEEPVIGQPELPEELRPVEGVFVTDDKCHLADEKSDKRLVWPRLDPYSPTGVMQQPAT
ncbi:MAG: NUDIX hydrolase [Candidatus Peregrinibacteria bacterium Gr01-1014_25]|nr:MAG: NUDIX hydrolase [Candidatus Peregrinibacteria bacterium Gr01-1014_25]